MANKTESPELVLVAPPEQAAAARRSLRSPEQPAPRRPAAPPPAPAKMPAARRALSALTRRGRLHRVLLGSAGAVIAGVALATVHHPDAAPTLAPQPTAPPLAEPGAGYVFGTGESFLVSPTGRSISAMTIVVCGVPVTLPPARIAQNTFTISTKDVRASGAFSSRRTAHVLIRLRHTDCGTLLRRATARLT
jgi:hypothetical protein